MPDMPFAVLWEGSRASAPFLVDGGGVEVPTGHLDANWLLLPAADSLFTPDHLQMVLGDG